MNVLAVQDEATFDVIDVNSMMPTSHTPTLQGMSKSYKTRLTQRGGSIAIADANGFFFANIVSDNAGHYNIKLSDEKFCQNHAVNDFIEYQRDKFLVTIVEGSYFALIERAKGTGMFDSGKQTKVRSICPSYLSMGI